MTKEKNSESFFEERLNVDSIQPKTPKTSIWEDLDIDEVAGNDKTVSEETRSALSEKAELKSVYVK